MTPRATLRERKCVTVCPPGARQLPMRGYHVGAPFAAVRSSLGDWSTGPTNEWTIGDGCYRTLSHRHGTDESGRALDDGDE